MVTRSQTPISAIENGVFYLNGKKTFLNSTDYPYYRDDPRNWADRLEKIKSLGNDLVSFYIPWRHHEIEIDGNRRYDFRGETLPNRDVIGFLELCQKLELKAIFKPGPFIHAEVNYGGLPDWVCPNFNPAIEPMSGATGEPFTWPGIQKKKDGSGMEELPLPAPFDPVFLKEVEGWLKTVKAQIIDPFTGPQKPIVLIQIANEGIYSNYQRAPWAYDFSHSSIELYLEFLRRTYGSLQEYNLRHATTWTRWSEIEAPRKWDAPRELSGILFYADWAAYQSYYMREILSRLKEWIPVDLPFVINANPPTDESFGIDAWLSRINPDDLPDIHYGFTNWIGVACKDPSVVERYQVMIKRARGANLEENWGFSELYEHEFAHPSVCLYQTMVQIASGATGYNIYTGVGTRHVNPDLDRMHSDVYPDHAPIDGEGKLTKKAEIVNFINRFFNQWGNDFLETAPIRPIGFGLYLPYAHSAVWVPDQGWKAAAALGIPNHGRILQQFTRLSLKNHTDFGLPNLQLAGDSQLKRYPALVVASGRWMDKQTQEKLRRYILQEGRLILVGEIPCLDERFHEVNILKDVEEKIQVVGLSEFCAWTDSDWNDRTGLQPGITCINDAARQALIWQYRHAAKDVDYFFVFSGNKVDQPLEFRFRSGNKFHLLRLSLPSLSSAVVRIQAGKISSILAKCENEDLQEVVDPECKLDDEVLMTKAASGWLYNR